jgi:hypothetical protein
MFLTINVRTGCKQAKSPTKTKVLSDSIIPGELLLSRARFLFIQFDKRKEYAGLKKTCKLLAGLLTKNGKLFLGRVSMPEIS